MCSQRSCFVTEIQKWCGEPWGLHRHEGCVRAALLWKAHVWLRLHVPSCEYTNVLLGWNFLKYWTLPCTVTGIRWKFELPYGQYVAQSFNHVMCSVRKVKREIKAVKLPRPSCLITHENSARWKARLLTWVQKRPARQLNEYLPQRKRDEDLECSKLCCLHRQQPFWRHPKVSIQLTFCLTSWLLSLTDRIAVQKKIC